MKHLHLHVLFINGVFSPKSNGQLRFHRVNALTSKELNTLVATISERVAWYLDRRNVTAAAPVLAEKSKPAQLISAVFSFF